MRYAISCAEENPIFKSDLKNIWRKCLKSGEILSFLPENLVRFFARKQVRVLFRHVFVTMTHMK